MLEPGNVHGPSVGPNMIGDIQWEDVIDPVGLKLQRPKSFMHLPVKKE
jgi:hypothetical protein